MSYILGNKTATSATLPNLQCNTVYTINVYVEGAQTSNQSTPRAVSLPARGMASTYMFSNQLMLVVCTTVLLQPLPLPLRSLFSWQMSQVSE